jgi:hypothetical protein
MLVSAPSARAASFLFGANESVVYQTAFDTAAGLTFANGGAAPGIGIVTSTVNGVQVNELHGTADCFFCSATHTFAAPLDLDRGDIYMYYSVRSQPNSQDQGASFLKLNLTDDPTLIEQYNVTLQIRPGSARGGTNQFLSIDPGFNIPVIEQQTLSAPANQFPTYETYEQFRVRFSKVSADTVEITPFWFDRVNGAWQTFVPQSGSTVPLVATIPTELLGLDSFRSVNLTFSRNVPFSNGMAVTQVLPAVVPEPSTLPGLFGLGALALAVVKLRQTRS